MNENKNREYISVMESTIKIVELEILEIDKDESQKLAVLLAKEYLDGLSLSLRIFKTLNGI
jgi:hypothetical protein